MTAARQRRFDADLGDVDATAHTAILRLSIFEIFDLGALAGDTLLLQSEDELIAARVVSIAGARISVALLALPTTPMRKVRVRKSTVAGKAVR